MGLEKELLSAVYIRAVFHQDCRARYLISLTPTITFLCFYFTVTVSAAPNDIATDHPLSSPIWFVTYHLLWLLEEIWPSFSDYNTKDSLSARQTDNSIYYVCCFCNNNN